MNSKTDWTKLSQEWSAWWAGDLARLMVVFRPPELDKPQKLQTVAPWDDEQPTDRPIAHILTHHETHLQHSKYPGDGAPPAEKWLPLLKRIRDGGKLCQVYVDTNGAQKIVSALGGRGFAFCLTESF